MTDAPSDAGATPPGAAAGGTEGSSPFQAPESNVSLPGLERELLAYWKEHKIFEKSVSQREGADTFVFYEGPPTANGMPHPGHVLTRVGKDVFLRHRSMLGYRVPRRGGWDTHGLPVEVEVEKDLGIQGGKSIQEYGVEAFSRKCIDSVFRYINEWEQLTDRVAFWLDMDDAYATFQKSYVESVWWALSELHRKDLLYQDYKVVWWWPQGGTALSAGEVGQGYKTVQDPSIVMRFRLADEERTSVLSWTTTPWTVPSNLALAVAEDKTYVTLKMEDGERLILAKARVEAVIGDKPYEVEAEYQGRELLGKKYLPSFSYREPTPGRAYEITSADFVTLDTGTGVVQMAPAFGEDDFRACKEQGFGFIQLVEPDGTFAEDVTDFAGRFCKDADRDIVRNLKERGLMWSDTVVEHEYPFCWRRDSDPLIQYARKSWYVRTTREIDRVIANNQKVNWLPGNIKDGRFGDFLRNNVDWAISRERWWGTPLPIWINDESGALDVISCTADILERNPDAFAAFDAAKAADPTLKDDLMVHKPWIDDVTWTKPGEPGTYRRVPEVIDCWFDAGSMPFAQWGYPHQRQAEFKESFPADFITEAVDQTRGWFYALIAINTLLFEDADIPQPYRNCVVLGHVTDKKGMKLSKRLKNYEPPLETIDQLGADAVRWSLFMSCLPGQNTRYYSEAFSDATREFLLKLWNVYSFFVTYARIDGWDPNSDGASPPLATRPPLDRWLLAELDATITEVGTHLTNYESYPAARRLSAFADSLSNWYVRRTRSRFWAKGDSADKRAAFATLFEALTETARLMAPFTPFLADVLYQRLTRTTDPTAQESVHLADYPTPQPERQDDELRASMARVRDVVTLGQRVRATHRLKVRQPLAEAVVVLHDHGAITGFEEIIAEELNVKSVRTCDDPSEYVDFKLVPNFKALGPRLGRQLPLVKKALAAANGTELYQQMEDTGHVELTLGEGETQTTVQLGPDEIEIRFEAHEGYAAAGEHGTVVVLDSRITPELRREGLAREVVNRIQRARKTLDLPYAARIEVTYAASDELAAAIEEQTEYIKGETLAIALVRGDVPTDENRQATDVEGESFAFRVRVSNA